MELGPEDVSLLERCPHFRGCYVQAAMELGPEGVLLLQRCPHYTCTHVVAYCQNPQHFIPEIESSWNGRFLGFHDCSEIRFSILQQKIENTLIFIPTTAIECKHMSFIMCDVYM